MSSGGYGCGLGMIFQFILATAIRFCAVAELAEYHTALPPLEAWRHTMSSLPSPSKSPTPTICQAKSVTVVRLVAVAELAEYHRALAPVFLWFHRISSL